MSKDLKYYISLDYPAQIVADPEGGYVASIPDLPGCYAFGETQQEALADLEDSKRLWLESHYEKFGDAPEPRTKTDFSGKFLLRIPKSLHESLFHAAKVEGISLNQYVSALLAERNAFQRLRNLLIVGGQQPPSQNIHISIFAVGEPYTAELPEAPTLAGAMPLCVSMQEVAE